MPYSLLLQERADAGAGTVAAFSRRWLAASASVRRMMSRWICSRKVPNVIIIVRALSLLARMSSGR